MNRCCFDDKVCVTFERCKAGYEFLHDVDITDDAFLGFLLNMYVQRYRPVEPAVLEEGAK